MAFNLPKFSSTKFQHRTERVPVPTLAEFFDPDEKAEFVIRGLEGEELARAAEAPGVKQNLHALAAALTSAQGAEKARALREALGLSPDRLPEDLARRITQLHLGCVEPQLDEQAAAKIFRVAPVAAYELTNRINLLSGQGLRPGESKASGAMKASNPPSTSATPEAKCSTNSAPTASPTAT
jgi:hypothetical protein